MQTAGLTLLLKDRLQATVAESSDALKVEVGWCQSQCGQGCSVGVALCLQGVQDLAGGQICFMTL